MHLREKNMLKEETHLRTPVCLCIAVFQLGDDVLGCVCVCLLRRSMCVLVGVCE